VLSPRRAGASSRQRLPNKNHEHATLHTHSLKVTAHSVVAQDRGVQHQPLSAMNQRPSAEVIKRLSDKYHAERMRNWDAGTHMTKQNEPTLPTSTKAA
jgi:hypothetical protein